MSAVDVSVTRPIAHLAMSAPSARQHSAPPVTTDHGRNTHDLTGCRCVYLQPIAYVDADVANPRLVRVGEEPKTPRLWIADRYRCVELVDRDTWQTDPQRSVDVLHQATAIHPTV